MRPEAVWGGLLVAGTAYEAYGMRGGRSGYTLSEVTRELFRTNHPIGKAAFLAGYLGFSAWFVPHIIAAASDAVRDVLAEQ